MAKRPKSEGHPGHWVKCERCGLRGHSSAWHDRPTDPKVQAARRAALKAEAEGEWLAAQAAAKKRRRLEKEFPTFDDPSESVRTVGSGQTKKPGSHKGGAR